MLVPDAETPGGERIKILDFGIAKLDPAAPSSVRTRTNSMMGTPIYMSPEQCRGIKQIDDRADVYALGVMMFEMLAGQPPFMADAPGDLIGMHMFKPPPTLRTYVPDVDTQLDSMVDSMLIKDPSKRPSMADVAMQLKQLGHFVSNVLPMRVVSSPDLSVSTSGRVRLPKKDGAVGSLDEVGNSGKFRLPQDAKPSLVVATESVPPGGELERALAPTIKSPAVRTDNPEIGAPKTPSATAYTPEPVRISPKAIVQAKLGTGPINRKLSAEPSPPSAAKEEATELLPSSGMPVASGGLAFLREHPQNEAETAPAMSRAEMQEAQAAYLRAKAVSAEPVTVPRMKGVSTSKKLKSTSLLQRMMDELTTRWAVPEQRLGILIFGGMVVLGLVLVVLILALGGQSS